MPSQRSALRIVVNVALDGALAAVAAVVARFLADPSGGLLHPLWFLGGGAIALLVSGLPFRLSQQYWRFAGLEDLVAVAGVSLLTAAAFASVWTVYGYPLPTLTFPIVHALTLVAFLGAPRVLYRVSRARFRPATKAVQSVLLIGAGEGADNFLRALAGEREPQLRVIGLLSLGHHQTGRRMQGRPILGGVSDVGRVLDRLAGKGRLPDMLVVTEQMVSGSRLSFLLEQAQRQGLTVRQAPRPTELQETDRIQLKPVVLEDLLNRPQVRLDRDEMARLVHGRRVVVTGAGGTIGSELARQVAALDPVELTLLDNGEFALWQIDLELSETFPTVSRKAVLADIRDQGRLNEVFFESRPDLVFHAAALKHVPMVEANPAEGLLTNAFGTLAVVDAAAAAGARATVLISTDKAVNPSSLMGASKRLAEIYCQALDRDARAHDGMRCVTVRFGNVLGSTGSVVPLFRRQLERGGPLTVTHPDMQRFFMTVREAVALVLQATVVAMAEARQGSTGEVGGIFVLDMGKPVRIQDLARQIIRLAGLRPDVDIELRFTGLRPGEKLFEEVFHGEEPPVPTGNPGLLMATPRAADTAIVRHAIKEIAAACRSGQTAGALEILSALIPEFEHNTGQAIAAEPVRSIA